MKNKTNNNWQLLSIPFHQELNNVLQQQYLAAQFIALAGRFLIPQKPDGSNINMQFLPEKEMLMGNLHPAGWAVGVQLKKLKVQILDKNLNVQAEIPLEGKTFDEAFHEFKTKLKNSGIDISGLKTEQPYELPTGGLKEGKFFNAGEQETTENIRYRHNARLIINELATRFTDVEPVRIWPHHFDTGTFATIARNEKGDATKTIGLGWAIPDNMVAEPYFYLSFWSEDPVNTGENPIYLPAGKWMMPDWNGAVLGVSEIIQKETAEEQYLLVNSFFETGIENLLERMK